jgi:hypothetical protein
MTTEPGGSTPGAAGATSCVYCSELAETNDHVPPKCLFPRPRPSDLITVPSCLACNQGAGADEEYFLASMMFTEAGTCPAGRALWQEKIRRMYAKNLGLRYRIAASLRRVNLVTPAGLFLGRHFSQKPDFPRLEKVVVKIVRGLYYVEHGLPLSRHTIVEALFLRSNREREAAEKYSHMLKDGQRAWPGIFSYRANRVEDYPQGSMWLLQFYDFAAFWALSHDNALTGGPF